MPDRFQPLLAILRREGLGAAALVPGPNFRRLMARDFHLMERPLVLLVPAAGPPVAVVPFVEATTFAALGFPGEVFEWRDETGPADAFAAAAAALGRLASLGVEGRRMRVFEGMALARAFPGCRLADADAALSEIRLRKTPDEIARLTEAIRRSEAALEATLAAVRLGQTEREIAARLTCELFAHGAEGLAFAPIVAIGANAAEAHAVPGDTPLRRGDALLIDFGGSHGGMNADITRTVFAAEASDGARGIYAAVLAACAAGQAAAAAAGATAHEVDDAVQRVLEAPAWAGFTRYKTGHGLGLDVHEAPQIMRGNHAALAPGMVFTIEPGLYRAGEIGVRIEDDVLVAADGLQVLTSLPRELRIVAGR